MWQLHSAHPATCCGHLLGAYPKLLVLLLRQGSQVELDAHMLAQHHLQQGQLISSCVEAQAIVSLASDLPGASFASPLLRPMGSCRDAC